MDDKPTVDIAIPTAGDRPQGWWVPIVERYALWRKMGYMGRLIVTSSAMPDTSKNMALDALMSQSAPNRGLTSYNRNELVSAFESEWLFFIDHDTVPPPSALPALLSHQAPIVAGVYYHRNEPHHPLMYRRQPNGLYRPIVDYEQGSVLRVDAVGMGCTLIHRSVFDTIREQYEVIMQPGGAQMLIHRDDIVEEPLPARLRRPARTLYRNRNGQSYLVEPVEPPVPGLTSISRFPFFTMEHGRTEDIYFCELAQRCGFEIVVDTAVECEHWHQYAVVSSQFYDMRVQAKLAGEMSPTTSPDGIWEGRDAEAGA